MKRFAVFLLAAIATEAAVASEVGARTPDVAKPFTLALVTSDVSAPATRTATSTASVATAAEMDKLARTNDAMSRTINQKLAVELSRLLDE